MMIVMQRRKKNNCIEEDLMSREKEVFLSRLSLIKKQGNGGEKRQRKEPTALVFGFTDDASPKKRRRRRRRTKEKKEGRKKTTTTTTATMRRTTTSPPTPTTTPSPTKGQSLDRQLIPSAIPCTRDKESFFLDSLGLIHLESLDDRVKRIESLWSLVHQKNPEKDKNNLSQAQLDSWFSVLTQVKETKDCLKESLERLDSLLKSREAVESIVSNVLKQVYD
jgi:hypothetical protein